MNFIKKFFTKKPKEEWKPNRVINVWEHNGWGDSIHWSDYDSGRLTGHLPTIPEVDDEIRDKMESGKIGRFKVLSVDRANGVPDMFFCTVCAVDYLE